MINRNVCLKSRNNVSDLKEIEVVNTLKTVSDAYAIKVVGTTHTSMPYVKDHV